jgi:hypothetical protein
MAYQRGILQIELFQKLRKIVCEGVVVIAGPRLFRTAVPTPVVCNHTVALLPEEKHLRIPRVCAQRPTVRKHDRRTLAPVFIENRCSIFRLNPARVNVSLNLFLRRNSARGFGLTGSSPEGKSRDCAIVAAQPIRISRREIGVFALIIFVAPLSNPTSNRQHIIVSTGFQISFASSPLCRIFLTTCSPKLRSTANQRHFLYQLVEQCAYI